jgi:prepilin-type N-terminal cleavage/methylation domain-containing protein
MNAVPGIACRGALSLADGRFYGADTSGGGARVARSYCFLDAASIDAFTLLELLVVVALIAVLAGGVGLALRQPGESVSLQSAQATLSAMLDATRARAALSQQDARCVIAADPGNSGTYLRYLRIVEQDPANSSNWLEVRDGVLLLPGVFVVSPTSTDVPGNPAWPASRRSTALSPAAQSMTINDVHVAPAYFVQFSPRGTTSRSGYLLVTAGRFTNGAATASLVFDDPDNLRGVLIRSSGSLTLVNDASGL